MRLRTVTKLGVIVSVVLFLTAVGFYGFARLSMTDRDRGVDLYSLVPPDCIGVLESDDIDHFLLEFSRLNYGAELDGFQFPGLFHYIMGGLAAYTDSHAHGLSSRMSRLLVSFHQPASPRDQLVYFRIGAGDGKVLEDMLRMRVPQQFPPKKETYRGKTVVIYPLTNDEYLSTYSSDGFFVLSYQKRLVEQVIDAHLDGKALDDDPVFARILAKKKSHTYFTLYGRMLSLPLFDGKGQCWTEFDFHVNSDVAYLTGDTFVPDGYAYTDSVAAYLDNVPAIYTDSLVISGNRDTTLVYMDRAGEESGDGARMLFNECLANLSREASFVLVTEMENVAARPEQFRAYLPRFIIENAPLFRPFILSAQLSLVDGKCSHILVFTYKN